MSSNPFKLSVGLGLLLASATIAHAVPITLTLEATAPHTVGPQSASVPCIIAGTQCQNPAGFGFTNFEQKGNLPAYDEDSPTYTISQFPFLKFDVAIDVISNSAQSETLQLFSVWVDADGAAGAGGFEEIYSFTGPAVIGESSSPGNGFADWTLSSIDLSSYASDALVLFNAMWDGAVAGPESFFLVATGTTVAEPATLVLLGLGLLAVGLSRRRFPRRRRG
jgi:hypothetical protein